MRIRISITLTVLFFVLTNLAGLAQAENWLQGQILKNHGDMKKPDLNPNSIVGLRMVEIVNALALKKASAVSQKLKELRTYVSGQPVSFHVDWSFDGTEHYVQTEKVFARYRTWLADLFAVVQSNDRAALLAALDHVQASYKP
ncbi:MAG: hypothetical protein U0223_11390 [Nitrospira sp.]|nr:hypothetical protein [Nitrospira sp.]